MENSSARFVGFLRALAFSVLCAAVMSAQDYRGKVQGLVTDSSSAILVGAKISLINVNTGVVATSESKVNGRYLFDYVDPGNYTITIEQSGFNKFLQENVLVQVRGDVTVDAVLRPGTVTETVTVTDAPAVVQFNTAATGLNIDKKALNDLPILQRSPFTAVYWSAAIPGGWGEMSYYNPFYLWAPTGFDAGGGTSGRNDVLLDGAPTLVGRKGSYVPPVDAVTEVSMQQNAADAEFGHSAGGVLSVAMKSGTNEIHGTAYYFGRNPKFNAVTNAVLRTPNRVRQHIWGGTAGGPIKKNKLFTFFTYEGWRQQVPYASIMTLPTELERAGDFSQSLNGTGGLRSIYDPWSTKFDPSTGVVSRTQFPGNRIPANRMDPTALRFMKDIWLPNGPGDDQTNVNNFRAPLYRLQDYWNFGNRTDWNISDKWKMYARVGAFRTILDQNIDVKSPALNNSIGGVMNATSIAADTVYLLNPTTVLNIQWSYSNINDDSYAKSQEITEADLGQFWTNNLWYKPYLTDIPHIFYPGLSIGSNTFGRGGYWWQHPTNHSYHARLSKNKGSHYLKIGIESRLLRSLAVRPNLMSFSFPAAVTADTFVSPNTKLRGDPYATFLLGAISSDSRASFIPMQRGGGDFYAGFIQDDFKLSRNITLNLGLRYEWESAPRDPEYRLSRYLDLNNPIPEMQSNPPAIPSNVASMMKAPYKFTGAWLFTDGDNPRTWKSSKTNFLPRLGIAVRVNDRTALGISYSRYMIPPLNGADMLGSLSMPGFSATTTVAPMLEGIPGAHLSDPFPASNPLILPVGKSFGRYTNLGGSATWDQQDQTAGLNDRFNVSFRRELPWAFKADITYFFNLGHDWPYTQQLNLSDPQLSYTYKGALDQQIVNPFYQYMTPNTFPGQLRNQATVTVGSLLVPYPQYGGLSQTNSHGIRDRYHALQLTTQRLFAQGYSVLATYNYNRESTDGFFNAPDEYAGIFTLLPTTRPRHRLTLSGTYDLPVGKGRPLLSAVHPVVNGVLGGWSTSWVYMFSSGGFITFGQAIVDGNPAISNPTADKWFDTSKVKPALPYTPRTNPWLHPGLTAPGYWSIDATLSKYFPIKERFRLEFKVEAYSLTNSFLLGGPNTDVYSSLFGRITGQGNVGRQIQYALRLHF